MFCIVYCTLWSDEVISLAFVIWKHWDCAGATEETWHMGDVTQEEVTTWHNTTMEPEAASVQDALSPVAPQVTSSSFMETQLLRGKPWSMGTRNWRQPDQWPTSSIIQIRLKMRMNTLAIFRNWKGKRELLVCSVLTFSSLIETQQSLGKPWSIGTRNWRQPDQWPIRSIIQIRLNILINTPIEFNNWKHTLN